MFKAHISVLDVPILPDDVSMLQRVFDRACETRGIAKTETEATELAASLVEVFQHGVTDESRLLKLAVAR